MQRVLDGVQQFLHACTRVGFNTAHTGSHGAFGDNLHHTDVSGCSHVRTTTEFYGRTELDNAYMVAVLLAEQSDGAQFFGFFDRNVAVFLQRYVGANLCINDVFHLADFLVRHLLEV